MLEHLEGPFHAFGPIERHTRWLLTRKRQTGRDSRESAHYILNRNELPPSRLLTHYVAITT
jgi:hypothetical protein